MNILGYLQRIGKALIVPVAVLPAAALLMGLGYWIDPVAWGGNSMVAAFLIKSGNGILSNMSMLFAIGVAYGMSKDKDGAAALAAFVGYSVVMMLLSPGAVAQIQSIDIESVPQAFAKVDNQFIGILMGVITAEIYNRYSKVELHKTMAFFSGKRLVPILTAFVAILVSFVLMHVWPFIFNGLTGFGLIMKDMGPEGAGLFGFFNRLLIPVGLHHGLNPVFWYDLAGINDIPNFLGGAQSIADGAAIPGETGRYMAGFFPIMMFGLPGAALAIYHTAKHENKEKVASMMIAVSVAAFVTGVTEPIEFSFMFLAPLLYLLHAVLTGISMYIAASMQWISGFGFSAGFIDLVLQSRNPLATNWYMLIPQGLVFFAVYYFSFKYIIVKYDLKTPGREENENNKVTITAAKDTDGLAIQYTQALGGKQNIVTLEACATRLRLTLNNRESICEATLKALGAMAVVKLGDNNLQVIVGAEAGIIADKMSALPQQE